MLNKNEIRKINFIEKKKKVTISRLPHKKYNTIKTNIKCIHKKVNRVFIKKFLIDDNKNRYEKDL